MRPADVISSDLRDRLDAARDYLYITIEWFDRGSPQCRGRDFGFWRIRAGPVGWESRPPGPELRYGQASPHEYDGPLIAESGKTLEEAVAFTLDRAEPRWPSSDCRRQGPS
jgi:hypothetical protein